DLTLVERYLDMARGLSERVGRRRPHPAHVEVHLSRLGFEYGGVTELLQRGPHVGTRQRAFGTPQSGILASPFALGVHGVTGAGHAQLFEAYPVFQLLEPCLHVADLPFVPDRLGRVKTDRGNSAWIRDTGIRP